MIDELCFELAEEVVNIVFLLVVDVDISLAEAPHGLCICRIVLWMRVIGRIVDQTTNDIDLVRLGSHSELFGKGVKR